MSTATTEGWLTLTTRELRDTFSAVFRGETGDRFAVRHTAAVDNIEVEVHRLLNLLRGYAPEHRVDHGKYLVGWADTEPVRHAFEAGLYSDDEEKRNGARRLFYDALERTVGVLVKYGPIPPPQPQPPTHRIRAITNETVVAAPGWRAYVHERENGSVIALTVVAWRSSEQGVLEPLVLDPYCREVGPLPSGGDELDHPYWFVGLLAPGVDVDSGWIEAAAEIVKANEEAYERRERGKQ